MRGLQELVAGLLVVTACGGGNGGGTPDSPPGDTPAATPQTVYLEFEGITLTPGADDATTDTSALVQSQVTLSAYADDQATRDQLKSQVVSTFTTALAGFAVDVVTTRPASGPYTMIVFTGTSDEAGLQAGIGGLAQINCGGLTQSPIVLMFGDTFGSGAPGSRVGSSGIAGLGVSHGIPSSNLQNDCLCWSGTACQPTGACTFGGPGTPVADGEACANGATTFDPRAAFGAVFGFAQ